MAAAGGLGRQGVAAAGLPRRTDCHGRHLRDSLLTILAGSSATALGLSGAAAIWSCRSRCRILAFGLRRVVHDPVEHCADIASTELQFTCEVAGQDDRYLDNARYL